MNGVRRCRSSGIKTDDEEGRLENALHEQIKGLMLSPPFRRRDLISDSGLVKEGWRLPDVTERDVELYLRQIQAGASGLENVAQFHPVADIRFAAQRALADVADIVLDEWPSKHQCVKGWPFGWLKSKAGSGLKQRWEQELHRTKEPKQTKFKPLDQARWSFISGLYALLLNRQGAVVRVLANVTATEEEIPDPIVNGMPQSWDRKRASMLLREFFARIPNYREGLRSKTINPWFDVEKAVVGHFERYWQTVVEPLATEGAPSPWVFWRDFAMIGFARGSTDWEIWAAWSKHAPSMKRMLLRYLRDRNPAAGDAASREVPFAVMSGFRMPKS